MNNLCIQCGELPLDENLVVIEMSADVCDTCLCDRLRGESLFDYDCGLVAHSAFIADLELTENTREAFPRL